MRTLVPRSRATCFRRGGTRDSPGRGRIKRRTSHTVPPPTSARANGTMVTPRSGMSNPAKITREAAAIRTRQKKRPELQPRRAGEPALTTTRPALESANRAPDPRTRRRRSRLLPRRRFGAPARRCSSACTRRGAPLESTPARRCGRRSERSLRSQDLGGSARGREKGRGREGNEHGSRRGGRQWIQGPHGRTGPRTSPSRTFEAPPPPERRARAPRPNPTQRAARSCNPKERRRSMLPRPSDPSPRRPWEMCRLDGEGRRPLADRRRVRQSHVGGEVRACLRRARHDLMVSRPPRFKACQAPPSAARSRAAGTRGGRGRQLPYQQLQHLSQHASTPQYPQQSQAVSHG